MLRQCVLVVAVMVACGMVGGCAGNGAGAQDGSPKMMVHAAPRAECLVCKKNGDMACIDVEVDAKTPFADYNGKRYFFCSEECRKDFLKNPGAFVGGK